MGKIAWVVYLQHKLVCTSITTQILSTNSKNLEELVFKIVNQIYQGAKIYTDNSGVWHTWKGKNKDRIYLIDHNDNLADFILRGKEIPKIYPRTKTFRFEYVRIEDDIVNLDD